MHNEFRCVLSNQEALVILNQAKIIKSYHVIDEYTGTKRIRTKNLKETIKEKYPTKMAGKTARIGLQIKLPGINVPTYLEFKITDQKFTRWEIEFEGEFPEKYKNRDNIRGWQILIDQDK